MEIEPLTEFPRDSADSLLGVIHLFRDIRASSDWQYSVILQRSRLVSLAPGETLLSAGDGGQWIFFLVRGELHVHTAAGERAAGERPLAIIRPGEVVGDLSMLLAEPRTADVLAAPDSDEVQVLGVDCSLFGDLEDFSLLHLPTKLVFYRNMVHSLRWKLEVYRSKHPHHPLANRHRRLKLFTGTRNSPEELVALAEQARALAHILVDWNAEFERGQLVDEDSDMTVFLEAMLS